ncbi:MAG: methyl-accepting chemotaxis protein [Candidatus Endobugula sp.]|jgi:methyl-accepting chemotaxis protein
MKKYNQVSSEIFMRVLCALVMVQVIPFLLILYTYNISRSESIANAEKLLLIESQKIEQEINLWINKKATVSKTLSKIKTIQSLDVTETKRILDAIVETNNIIIVARVDGSDGVALARSDNKTLKNYSSRQYFRQVKNGAELGQEVVIGETQKKPILCFAVPIQHENTFQGALTQCATLNDISLKITSLKLGEAGYAFLIDDDKKLIASGDNTIKIGKELKNMERHPAVSALSNDKVFEYTNNGIDYMAIKIRLGFNWLLFVQQPKDEILANTHKLKFGIYVLILFSIIFSILSVIILSRRISKPVVDAYQQLEHIALHDPLTQLPNRKLFDDRLAFFIEDSTQQKTKFAYLAVDLTDFKAVNDNYGHRVGDEVLIVIGSRIKQKLRDTDIIARIGGDEFIIILRHQEDECLHDVVGRILTSCDEPICFEGVQVNVKMNIGVSLFPEHAINANGLYSCADKALYLSKRRKVNYAIHSS